MWYVIQVINGREDVMRDASKRVVPSDAMQEIFIPQYQTEIKVHGDWSTQTSRCSPVIFICDTADPPHRATVFAAHGRLCSVLSQDGRVCAAGKKRRGPAYWRLYA